MKLTIYGASDDLVEIEGDLREEFNPECDEAPSYLAFGDGTVLSIEYTKAGIWRIYRQAEGSARFEKQEGTDADTNYSDRVTLEGDLKYVVFGGTFRHG